MPAAHPPLTQIAAALRTTTEHLARELAAPTSQAPRWSEFEWRIARAVTAMHGVSSLLDGGLLWDSPEAWRRFLRGQHCQAVGRHQKIESLLRRIDERARSAGVALVALKGAALYAEGIYAPGERPMGDIDLLVRPEHATAVARVLEDCGHRAAFSTRRHQVFVPQVNGDIAGDRLGESVDDPIKVEVHTKIAEHLPVAATDITSFLHPVSPRPGLNAYPGKASLMMHLLLHAAGNMRARALRLIQLHDIALLAPRLGTADWDQLLAARADDRDPWWALAPLMLTARYYPKAVPPELFPLLRRECPWLLGRFASRQRLADVSYSNIRIQAFPGVEWCRTPREAASFMRGRIWPSREARLELQEGAAQIAGSSTIPWYGIPHGARIVRWIFSRPPRVQTLLSVQAALTQER
jgi:hypothetical protein